MRGPYLVLPCEMNVVTGSPNKSGRPGKMVESLLCIELDDETARAAGWATPDTEPAS